MGHAVSRIRLLVLLLVFSGAPSHSQTVGEAVKMPEAQQLEIIMRFAKNASANLCSKVDTKGKAKSPEQYEADRSMGDLVSALFTPALKDANQSQPDVEPPGPKMVLFEIANAAREDPNKKVLDVMGGLVDWAFAHFYTNLTQEQKIKDAKVSDDLRVKYYRLNMELYDDRLRNEHTIAELELRDKELTQKVVKMYDNAIILSNGQHVMPNKEGDFILIKRDIGDPQNETDIKVLGSYKVEAQRIQNCMERKGISTGHEAIAAGCR